MTMTIEEATKIRLRLQQADLTRSDYETIRRELLIANEQRRNKAYDYGRVGGPSIDTLSKPVIWANTTNIIVA